MLFCEPVLTIMTTKLSMALTEQHPLVLDVFGTNLKLPIAS